MKTEQQDLIEIYQDYIDEEGYVQRYDYDKKRYYNTGTCLKGPKGNTGNPGRTGKNGCTPRISESTGNWVIGDVDTGIHVIRHLKTINQKSIEGTGNIDIYTKTEIDNKIGTLGNASEAVEEELYTAEEALAYNTENSLQEGDEGYVEEGDVKTEAREAVPHSVKSYVDDKILDLIDGAPELLNTLKELSDALPTKLSDLTNDVGYITQEDGQLQVNQQNITVISNQPFPSTWPKDSNHSFSDLVSAIDADSSAIAGKVYLATIHYSDLNSSIGLHDAELKVEIMDSSNNHKIARLTITSANKSPYYWQTTMWNGQLYGWKSFVPSDSLATVATSGSYNDLSDKPTIPQIWRGTQVQYDALDPNYDNNTIYIITEPPL